jgi:hypothetical protein
LGCGSKVLSFFPNVYAACYDVADSNESEDQGWESLGISSISVISGKVLWVAVQKTLSFFPNVYAACYDVADFDE